MAYAFQNTFEGGSNGTAVTTGNSGGSSGDALTVVNLGTGGTVQYGTMPWGGQGAIVTNGTTATYLRWDDSSATSGDSRRIARFPVWLDDELTATTNLVTAYTATDQSMGSLALGGPGGNLRKLVVMNSGYTAQVASFSAAALSLDTLYWVEFVVASGATSAGTLGWRILAADGVTEVQAYTNTAITTRTDVPARIRFGSATNSSVDVMYFDDLRWETAASGWLGPLTATPPTLALSDAVRHIIDARGSSVPTGTVGYSIEQFSGATTTAEQIAGGIWAVTPHATETLVYEVTATGSLGGSVSAMVEVPPLASGGTVPVVQLIWNGTDWV